MAACHLHALPKLPDVIKKFIGVGYAPLQGILRNREANPGGVTCPAKGEQDGTGRPLLTDCNGSFTHYFPRRNSQSGGSFRVPAGIDGCTFNSHDFYYAEILICSGSMGVKNLKFDTVFYRAVYLSRRYFVASTEGIDNYVSDTLPASGVPSIDSRR